MPVRAACRGCPTARAGCSCTPPACPGAEYGGDLGATARAFVDFLAAAGQSWWQMLPVGPTGYGNSPYSALSAFAGSPALVSARSAARRRPAVRATAGTAARASSCRRRSPPSARGGGARGSRRRFAAGAARTGWTTSPLYRAIKRAHGERAVDALAAPGSATATPGALAEARADAGRRHRLRALRAVALRRATGARCARYAHERGIGLIGDIPIFVAHDSADVWRDRELFTLDARGRADAWSPACRPTTSARPASAGATRSTAGLAMRKTGYAWWIERFRATLARFDAVRLDHFIGFERYWEIPAASRRRCNGHWAPGPGAAFFERAAQARSASCRSSPRISAWSRRRCSALRERLRAARHQDPAVRVRHRSERRPTSCRTTTRATPSSTPARTTTTRRSAGSHDPGSGTRSAEQTETRAAARAALPGHEHPTTRRERHPLGA